MRFELLLAFLFSELNHVEICRVAPGISTAACSHHPLPLAPPPCLRPDDATGLAADGGAEASLVWRFHPRKYSVDGTTWMRLPPLRLGYVGPGARVFEHSDMRGAYPSGGSVILS
jgi:hypothetical protein